MMTQTLISFEFPSRLEAERQLEILRKRIDRNNEIGQIWSDWDDMFIAAIATLPDLEKRDLPHLFKIVIPALEKHVQSMKEYGAFFGGDRVIAAETELLDEIEIPAEFLGESSEITSKEVEELRDENAKLRGQYSSLQTSFRVVSERQENIKGKYLELLQKEVKGAEEHQRITDLERQLQAKTDECAELEKQLAEAEQSIINLANSRAKLAQQTESLTTRLGVDSTPANNQVVSTQHSGELNDDEKQLLDRFLSGDLAKTKDVNEILQLAEALDLGLEPRQPREVYLAAITEELRKHPDAPSLKWGQPTIPALLFEQEEKTDSVEPKTIDVTAQTVEPLDDRVKKFIKVFKPEKTTWEDMEQYIQGDEVDFLRQLQMQRTRKHDRIMEWLPVALANHIEKHGRSNVNWVGKTLRDKAEEVLAQRFDDTRNIKELSVQDALRVETVTWESKTRDLADLFLNQDKEFSLKNTIEGVNKMLQKHLEDYPDKKQEIKDLMIELFAGDEVVLSWVADSLGGEPQDETCEWDKAQVKGQLDKLITPSMPLSEVFVRNVIQALFVNCGSKYVEAIATYIFEYLTPEEDTPEEECEHRRLLLDWTENAYEQYCRDSILPAA